MISLSLIGAHKLCIVDVYPIEIGGRQAGQGHQDRLKGGTQWQGNGQISGRQAVGQQDLRVTAGQDYRRATA